MSANVSIVPRSTRDPAGRAGPEAPRVWTRYELFLGDLRTGLKLEEAMEKHLVKRADIEAACMTPDGLQAFTDALAVARRRAWSVLDIHEVFRRIASGTKVKESIEQVSGDASSHASFLAVVTEDKALWGQYQTALKSRALLMADDLEDWAAEDKDDVLENGKGGRLGNNAAVARDKLRVDTRLRLMGSWFPALFNDREKASTQVNVQINHAAQLEEARTRAKTRRVILPAEPDRVPIETLQEQPSLPPPDDWRDTSWLDGPK